MFQRVLTRAIQARYVAKKSRCHRHHNRICCNHIPPIVSSLQVRNYAVKDIDAEIAELKFQHIPEQDIPEVKDNHSYEVLNVKMSGYDCNTVEHFTQYVHKLATRLELDVIECYALQTKATQVTTLQVPGQIVDEDQRNINEFMLHTHGRIVQIKDLSTKSAPLFLELLQINTPEGVTIRVEPHSQEHYKERFVRKEVPESLF